MLGMRGIAGRRLALGVFQNTKHRGPLAGAHRGWSWGQGGVVKAPLNDTHSQLLTRPAPVAAGAGAHALFRIAASEGALPHAQRRPLFAPAGRWALASSAGVPLTRLPANSCCASPERAPLGAAWIPYDARIVSSRTLIAQRITEHRADTVMLARRRVAPQSA
jgi:hypothetical protein